MDTSLNLQKSSKFAPWRFEQSEIAPNLLLMCKLLILIMIAYQYPIKLQDPYIPFIPALDYFNTIPGVFKSIVLSGFIVSTLAIFCNIKIRIACFVLGIVIMLEQIASQPGFKNHVFVCGCFFILTSFTKKGEDYKLLFWQLALIYLGAFINKVLDPDWHSGAFMHNWLQNARENSPYIFVSQLLPENWFAIILSYSALLSEGLLGILLFFKKYRKYTFWIILLFHTVLYSFTAFRFGHFYDDLVIILLIFINWPQGIIQINYKQSIKKIKNIHGLLDWDQKFKWNVIDDSSNNWMELKTNEGETFKNYNAIRKLLISTPSFFIALFAFDCAVKFVFDGQESIKHMINMPIVWALIIFFLPLLRYKNEKTEAN